MEDQSHRADGVGGGVALRQLRCCWWCWDWGQTGILGLADYVEGHALG